MPYGLLASLILHALVLGWALLSIGSTPPLAVKPAESIEISIISADDTETRQKQGDRDSKIVEAAGKQGEATEPPIKEAPKPTPPPPPAAAPPPAPPPDPITPAIEKAALEPPPAPVPDPPKVDPIGDLAAAEAAKPLPKPPAPKVVRPPPKPVKPKVVAAPPKPPKPKPPKKVDFTQLASAAIEKSKDSSSAPAKPAFSREHPKAAALRGPDGKAPPGVGAGTKVGKDTALTASQIDGLKRLFREATHPCINAIPGTVQIPVQFEIKLNQDGSLKEPPKAITTGTDPKLLDAIDSGKRSLIQCAPYRSLPPDMYATWSDFYVWTGRE